MWTRLADGLRLRQLGRVHSENYSDAALVLLGHGTTLNAESAAPVFRHAAELRRRNLFAAVREAFWKQEPHIKTVLAEISAPRIFIVPFFISEGYFSTEVIPAELGFRFPDRLSLVTRHSSLFYCRPVGSHDLMTKVILARADEVVKQFPFPRAPKNSDTTLLIAGHGTGRNANSRKAVERQVELIRALNIFAEVGAVFMEEAPFIKGCHATVSTKNIVIVPFFISDGLHAVEDIPVLLGEPERFVKERLAAGQPTWRNPTEREGKRIWYSASVGTEPLLADVILERVKEACGSRCESAQAWNERTHVRCHGENEFMKKLRIGILSTAGIGKKNWKAIFNSGNCVVAAVASRDLDKSRNYIDECQRESAFAETPRAFGSYEELIASPDVDAIYNPLPTGLRKEWVLRAAAAGKHVLCEKPCGTSVADLDEMIAACAKNQVQFLDGVMFMHSPRLAKIREILDDEKSIGEIRHIASAFSFLGGGNFFADSIRVNRALEPAGCLGDLGWYCIRFALWTLNWQLPREVTAKNLSRNTALAPTEFTAELLYDNGVSMSFYCSFLAANQQWVHVSGQKGWLRVPGFVHPLNSYEPAFEVNDAEVCVASDVKCLPGADPRAFGHATAQDTRMWRNFANQIFSGQLNADWPMWAQKTQIVLDACHEASRHGAPVKI